MAEAALIIHTFKVGKRTVTVAIPRLRPGQPAWGTIEWAPDLPAKLSLDERRQYRKGFAEALGDVTRETATFDYLSGRPIKF